MSDAAERSREAGAAAVLGVAAAFTLALYAVASGAFGAPTPLVSEDWTQLARMGAVPSLAAALDLAREPLRPFQHAFFWLLAHASLDPASPAAAFVARAPAFVFHLASIGLVFALARALGATRGTAALAALLFASFPNVKSLAWPSAIGSPGRVALELAALNLLARRAPPASWARGLGAVAFMALAMGFHESGFLMPALAGAVALGSASDWRAGARRSIGRLREPAFAACVALAIGYAIYLAFLRAQRYHHAKSLEALPANLSKAALALAPEIVRAPAIEGLRGHLGLAGYAFGALALLAVAALFALMLRAGPPLRWSALAIAIELAFPAFGVAFAQRHAYLAPAFLALGAAAWLAQRRSIARRLAVGVWAALWAFDSVRDACEYRAAGAYARDLVAVARAERAAAGPSVPIAILDAPDTAGAEEDVPLFNWGLPQTFAAHALHGPWLYWRTRAFRTSTDVELVQPERVEAALRSGSPRVIRWDPADRRFAAASLR